MSLLKITNACLDLVSKRYKYKLDHGLESQTSFMMSGDGEKKVRTWGANYTILPWSAETSFLEIQYVLKTTAHKF